MRILAVDDGEIALNHLKLCLSSAGYEDLEIALPASKAMEKTTKIKLHFDRILLDIEMLKTDGSKVSVIRGFGSRGRAN